MLAMLSKETGVMVLPMVILYHLRCKLDSITFIMKDKDKSKTILKYILMVRKHINALLINKLTLDHHPGCNENCTEWLSSNILQAGQPSQLCRV